MYKYLMEEQRRWSQTLSIDAQRQDKRQQAETEIQESPSKCKTKFFTMSVIKGWSRFLREGVESLSLELLKT